ncbi:hypothetical protein KDW_15830 [Dictyobacter vulcani]|uniref:Band 7 domain-containing protein n=1 Tax=Dictyobacter vulcani TaxID=2607529 RepID=A0A5J4KMD1_9CHLR|nr:hypothetical protein KDW_15830 [Dictyobacter vulcani]
MVEGELLEPQDELVEDYSDTPVSAEPPASDPRRGAPVAASSPFEFIKHVSQYITLILIPLLLGGLTCLFVLPQVATGHAVLPPEGFWPILIVIIAVTIAQAVTVYYAGADNGVWTLATLGGFCLLLLVACFSVYGIWAGILVLVVLIALGIVLARRCVHPVPEGSVDIIFSFKKYARTLYPGFNILLPWEEVSAQLNVEEVQWMCPAQIIQLSRTEDVMLHGVMSYQLVQEDAYLAVTQVKNWEDSLRQQFQTRLQEITTVFRPDDFLPWPDGRQRSSMQPGDDDFAAGFERREQINNYLFQLLRDKAALWGVQINWVSIRDIEIAPHGSIKIEPVQTPPPAQPAVAPQPQAPAVTQAIPVPTTTAPRTYTPAPANNQPKPAEEPPRPQYTENKATQSYELTEEVLIQAYTNVQDGRITDPATIRGIAARFDKVASDPRASQSVNFDAAQAARNLYEQARKHEHAYQGELYHDETQPEWAVRRPRDENLMAGG